MSETTPETSELREREEVRGLPFTLRVPTNRADGNDGRDLNVGTNHVDVQVILDPDMKHRGEHRPGYGGAVIALREWNQQVFLHELLHAATAYVDPPLPTIYPPHGHDVLARVEVALWETGWRMVAANEGADSGEVSADMLTAVAQDVAATEQRGRAEVRARVEDAERALLLAGEQADREWCEHRDVYQSGRMEAYYDAVRTIRAALAEPAPEEGP